MSSRTGNVDLLFVYFETEGFSGQSRATEVLREGLKDRGFEVDTLPLPSLRRDRRRPPEMVRFAAASAGAAVRAPLHFLRDRPRALHVNMGLSWSGFVRLAPIVAAWRLLGRGPTVISLHGSNFLEWDPGSARSRALVRFVNGADMTTVLSPRQKADLVDRGAEARRITVVPNASPLPIDASEHTRPGTRGRDSAGPGPIRILYLSNLIDSKGWPEYLDALERLVRMELPRPLEAILCGPVVMSPWCERFGSVEEKRRWISAACDRINAAAGGPVVRWIPGAFGDAKAALFREADIFVFPSTYPVEAQPLVLLEAMASGCAIVTSNAGEIPWTIAGAGAMVLETVTGESVGKAVAELIGDPDRMRAAKQAGPAVAEARFGLAAHLDRWVEVLAASGIGPRGVR